MTIVEQLQYILSDFLWLIIAIWDKMFYLKAQDKKKILFWLIFESISDVQYRFFVTVF